MKTSLMILFVVAPMFLVAHVFQSLFSTQQNNNIVEKASPVVDEAEMQRARERIIKQYDELKNPKVSGPMQPLPQSILDHLGDPSGNDCTYDCSGHEAGYNWAKSKGITEAWRCSGNSNSFIEGCLAYVKENY